MLLVRAALAALVLLALVAAGALLVLAPPHPMHTAGAHGESTDGIAPGEVRMRDVRNVPEEITVAPGTTVTWVNDDDMGHTVTPMDKAAWGSEGSGDAREAWLHLGDSWSFTFTEPGTYRYYCIPHVYEDRNGELQGMVGVVHVRAEP